MANTDLRSFLNTVVGSHNYYEFVILDSNFNETSHANNESVSCFNSSLSANVFHELLNKLGRKGSVKQYKENIIGDIHYLNFDNKEVNVIQKSYVDYSEYSGKFVCLSGSKKKLNILSYPSSYHCDYESFHKVYQVKINNRILVKFIQGKCMGEQNTYYNIIVSYTHDDTVEKKHNIDELIKVIMMLTQ